MNEKIEKLVKEYKRRSSRALKKINHLEMASKHNRDHGRISVAREMEMKLNYTQRERRSYREIIEQLNDLKNEN